MSVKVSFAVEGVIFLAIFVTAKTVSATTAPSGCQLTGLTDQLIALQKQLIDAKAAIELSVRMLNETAAGPKLCNCQKPAACPDGYLLNPYSNTCYGLVKESKTWQEAKNYCEADGGYLATFETLESASWFVRMRRTQPEWMKIDAWIGGRKDANDIWRWDGRIKKPISYDFWAPNQPDSYGQEDCMSSEYHTRLTTTRTYKFNDKGCFWGDLKLFCEKV